VRIARGGQVLERTDTVRLLDAVQTIPFDSQSAAVFDRLRRNRGLRKIGRPDLLIASSALARDATLVTRNTRHFQSIPNLKLENRAD
jgi:tRNA(fMet)-specific endonuclease VapC